MVVKALESVRTALDALEVIGRQQPIGVSALARSMAITKSAAQRVLVTLAEAGWIASDGAKATAWVLTSKAMVVGSHFARSNFRERALPALMRLRDEIDETTFLAVRDGRDVVFVAVLESSKRLRVWFPVGTAQLAVHTAAGASLAVDLDAIALAGAFGDDAEDRGFRQRLAQVRDEGFACNLGEDVPDYHNVAAHTGRQLLDHLRTLSGH